MELSSEASPELLAIKDDESESSSASTLVFRSDLKKAVEVAEVGELEVGEAATSSTSLLLLLLLCCCSKNSCRSSSHFLDNSASKF